MANGARSLPAPALAAGVVLVVCLVVVLATARESFWIADNGNKALVAQRLLDTGFRDLRLDYPAVALDPEGIAFPIPPPFAIALDGGFVSFYPPAFSALAAPGLALLGPVGLRLPAALGVAACAWLFAVWLATSIPRSHAALAGLGLALATPLFFYGVTVWEHSLTVALALASFVALGRIEPSRAFAAGACVGLACWLREELVLLLPALAVACALETRRWRPAAWLTLGALVSLVPLLAFNAAVFGNPLGVHVMASLVGGPWSSGFDADGLSASRVVRAWVAQLAAIGRGGAEAVAFAAALLGIALPAAARRPGVRAVALGLALLAGLGCWGYGTWQIATAERPLFVLPRYNGLLVQLPLLCLSALGLTAVWRLPRFAPWRLGITASLGFFVLELAFRSTTRVFTGGQWGPRELLPAVPALVALALAAADASDEPQLRRWLRGGLALLAAAGLLSSGVGTWLLGQQKREAQQLQDAILASSSRVVVTTNPLLAQHLASMWGRKAMLLVEDAPTMARVVGAMRRRRVPSFLTVGPVLRDDGHSRCELLARHEGRRLHYLDSDLRLCRIPEAPTARER